MLSSADLDQFGKNLSTDFLTNKAPLTEGLSKLASKHGLNRQQMSRVAESANVETYLDMLKTSEDKYLNFELANSAMAYKSVASINKKAESTVDYDQEPRLDLPESIFSLYDTVDTKEFLKEASLNSNKSEAEHRKEAHILEGTLQFIENHMQETVADFEKAYSTLEYFTKQAVLEGTSFNDTKQVIDTAIPGIAPVIADSLKKHISEKIPHISLEKEAHETGIPNPDSNYFKIACEVGHAVECFDRLQEASGHYEKKYKELVKEAHLPEMYKTAAPTVIGGAWGIIKGLLKFFKSHPKTGLSIVGAPMVYKAGKSKGALEQGGVLQKSFVHFDPYRNPKKIFR